jgi:hypothetical protein
MYFDGFVFVFLFLLCDLVVSVIYTMCGFSNKHVKEIQLFVAPQSGWFVKNNWVHTHLVYIVWLKLVVNKHHPFGHLAQTDKTGIRPHGCHIFKKKIVCFQCLSKREASTHIIDERKQLTNVNSSFKWPTWMTFVLDEQFIAHDKSW